MPRILIFAFSQFLFQTAMSADVFSLDASYPVADQVGERCPWIDFSEVQKITVIAPEPIGWSGGDVGKALGNLLDDTGLETNFSTIAADLPRDTRAILFDTQYFNTNGGASIVVEELSLTNTQGDVVSLSLNVTNNELKQTSEQLGEALLVCFTEEEVYVRASTRVSHKNVDGSRPAIGISAFVYE